MNSSRIVFLLLFSVVVLGLAVVISWKGYEKHLENEIISEKVQKLQEEAGRLQEETEKLNDKIAYLRTPDYVEREAKDKLNLKKPGESVALIQPDRFQSELIDQKDGDQSERGVHVVTYGSISNPIKWWDFFFGPE